MKNTQGKKTFESLRMNVASDVKTRWDTLEDKTYLVIPCVMITTGVHNGSAGALLYPEEELNKTPEVWNHKPIVVYHPTVNGQGVSACDPDVLNSRKIGLIMNTTYEALPPTRDETGAIVRNGRLKAEAWLDVPRVKKIDPRVLHDLEAKKMVEISTGLFTDNVVSNGTWNGESFSCVARNYRPDHLAILPDQKGSCSIADGAGLLRNASQFPPKKDEGDEVGGSKGFDKGLSAGSNDVPASVSNPPGNTQKGEDFSNPNLGMQANPDSNALAMGHIQAIKNDHDGASSESTVDAHHVHIPGGDGKVVKQTLKERGFTAKGPSTELAKSKVRLQDFTHADGTSCQLATVPGSPAPSTPAPQPGAKGFPPGPAAPQGPGAVGGAYVRFPRTDTSVVSGGMAGDKVPTKAPPMINTIVKTTKGKYQLRNNGKSLGTFGSLADAKKHSDVVQKYVSQGIQNNILTNEVSHDAIRDSIYNTLDDKYGKSGGIYIVSVYGDHFIFSNAGKLYCQEYDTKGDGKVEFKDLPYECVKTVQYKTTDGTVVGNSHITEQGKAYLVGYWAPEAYVRNLLIDTIASGEDGYELLEPGDPLTHEKKYEDLEQAQKDMEHSFERMATHIKHVATDKPVVIATPDPSKGYLVPKGVAELAPGGTDEGNPRGDENKTRAPMKGINEIEGWHGGLGPNSKAKNAVDIAPDGHWGSNNPKFTNNAWSDEARKAAAEARKGHANELGNRMKTSGYSEVSGKEEKGPFVDRTHLSHKNPDDFFASDKAAKTAGDHLKSMGFSPASGDNMGVKFQHTDGTHAWVGRDSTQFSSQEPAKKPKGKGSAFGGSHGAIGNAENWIAAAIKKPGALRKTLGAKAGEPIKAGKLQKAANQKDKSGKATKTAKRANLAMTLKKLAKSKTTANTSTEPAVGLGSVLVTNFNSQENVMFDKASVIEALIANSGGQFTDENRPQLELMNEKQLKIIINGILRVGEDGESLENLGNTTGIKGADGKGKPKAGKTISKQAVTDSDDDENDLDTKEAEGTDVSDEVPSDGDETHVHALTGTSKLPKAVTNEEYIKNAPPALRAVFNRAIKAEASKKANLIKLITNSPKNKFALKFLETREVDELEGMAALVGNDDERTPDRTPANYFGQALDADLAPVMNQAGPIPSLPEFSFEHPGKGK